MKYPIKVILILNLFFSFFVLKCHAISQKRLEQGLKKVLGTAIDTERQVIDLTSEETLRIVDQLGGRFFFKEEFNPNFVELVRFEYYKVFRSVDREHLGSAIVLDERGKWGNVEFVIIIDPFGAIIRATVVQTMEKMGKFITRRSFLKQFDGKVFNDSLLYRKDIFCQSGATVSAKCAIFAIKKSLIMFHEIIEKSTG